MNVKYSNLPSVVLIETVNLTYPQLRMSETTPKGKPENDKLAVLALAGSLLLMVGLPAIGFAVLLLFFIAIYLAILLSPFFIDQYAHYLFILQQHPIYSTVIFAIFGFGLFQLRTHLLSAFALIEITGGIALAWNVFHSNYPSGILFWTAVMGAVYLLVRGFDNAWKGYKDFRKEKDETEFGYSTISFDAAIKHALLTIVARDVEAYEKSTDSYNPAILYSVINTEIYMDTPVVYEVELKIKRRNVKKSVIGAAKYNQLEDDMTLFSTKEYFPFVKNRFFPLT